MWQVSSQTIGRIDWLDAEHFLQTKGGQLLKVHARTGRAEPFVDPVMLRKSLLAALKREGISMAGSATSEEFMGSPPSADRCEDATANRSKGPRP